MKMARWRRGLYILWFCSFLIQVGFSLIMPFLPRYLAEIGVQGPAISLWSGVIFAANFVTMAIVSPLWGAVSDRVGRKPMMLRSTLVMGVIVALMGFAQSPQQLLLLRLLQGVAAGFPAAATAYLSGIAPRDQAGRALGMLGTGNMAGSILGPIVGGLLAQVIGYRPIFFLTGGSCLVAGLIVLFTIQEHFTPAPAGERQETGSAVAIVRRYPVVMGVAVVLFMNMFSVLTAEPILSTYLEELDAPAGWVSLLSGLVFSVTGLAQVIISPAVGSLSDRVGSRPIIAAALGGAAAMYLLQGMASEVWHMIALRFVLGLFTGGLMPAANGLIARSVPRELQGRAFGVTQSAMFMGNTAGPLVGGALAAAFGPRAVFPVTGALLLADLAWVLVGLREPVPTGSESAAD